jgi:hypothetical protein
MAYPTNDSSSEINRLVQTEALEDLRKDSHRSPITDHRSLVDGAEELPSSRILWAKAQNSIPSASGLRR